MMSRRLLTALCTQAALLTTSLATPARAQDPGAVPPVASSTVGRGVVLVAPAPAPPASASSVAPPPTDPGVAPVDDGAAVPDSDDRKRSPDQLAPRGDADLELLGIGIDLGAYFWVDTGYLSRDNAQAGQYDQVANYMQGRFVFSAAFTKTFGDFYATARGELMGLVNEFAKSQYEPHTLDAFLRIGHQKWGDVTVGRFLGWEVYYRGQGIELFTAEEAGALGAPTLYLLDFTRGYRNESGQIAIHAYPFEGFGIEVAGVYGQESNQNNLGVRPVLSFEIGDFLAVAGYEYLKQSAQTEADKVDITSSGFAGRLQYTLGPVTFGANGSRAHIDYIDIQELVDTDRTLDRSSVGGFADIDFWNNSIGLGYHRTFQDNEQGESNTHDQLFVSYLYRLPIKGLSLKLVYGFASGHIEDIDTSSEWTNELHSIRVRALYTLD